MTPRVIVALAATALVAVGAISFVAGRSDRATELADLNGLIATPALAQGIPSFTDGQRSEIEGIIRDYLMTNPEIIRDAIAELQRKEEASARESQVEVIASNAPALFKSDNAAVIGNPDGDVTLVEFFDYNCGYCRRAHADMTRLIAEDPNLRVVLKEFPILGPGSVEAAQIATAVHLLAPEKYGEFHDLMLGEPGQVDGNRAIAIAVDLGVDEEALRKSADSDETKASISEAMALASELDLTGTPSYVTRQQVIVGAVGYDVLKTEIAAARAACNADPAAC